MVPKGWKTVTLKDLLDGQIKNGYSPNATNSETGYWVLGLGALADEGIISSEIKPVLPEKKVLQSLLKKDDFLVSRSNTPDKVGRSIRFKNEVENCSYPDLMMRFRIDDNKADKEFIEHQLKSSAVRIYFKNCAAGSSSTMVKINKGILEKTPIVAPPIKEQKKIAQILSTWDKAITVTEKLLTNSQQQKKALMQQLLTGRKRLLNENGVRFNGKWEKKLLSDVADVYQPKTISQSMMSDSGYPVYGANGVIGFYQEFNHETEQIAVTCRGSTCGIVNWTQAKSWITGNAMVINTDNYSYVSKKFLFYTLNGNDLKYLISGSGQPQITGNIKTHIINLPCIEEQQKIATVLSAADAEISTLEKKIACLKDEKKALMQQLLTGKRRVKVDEAVAA
ncbi:restriction endonuclease subunit S [Leclercia adecarboxylata]|uniref:restriction endonuclease subunit S n=1 Tax=Leclercia adecarboxylata TaxID=83655 RepID=UPI0013E08839|nr:restriction endonuclease subunit S [Leclercia adecarboxylata]QIG33834.1 restriction endonuclease subunit S [Leclercia adecarboxylata]